MSDPRQEDRLKAQAKPRELMPAEQMERIKLGLSPCDDELPLAQAVRQKELMDKAAKAFARRNR